MQQVVIDHKYALSVAVSSLSFVHAIISVEQLDISVFATPRINNVEPYGVPSSGGPDAVVSIFGDNFPIDSSAFCIFGERAVSTRALTVSRSQIQCTVPSYKLLFSDDFEDVRRFRMVSVSVTFDAYRFTVGTPLSLVLFPAFGIDHMLPLALSQSESTRLTFTASFGTFFSPGLNYSCVAADSASSDTSTWSVTSAWRMSPTMLMCDAPYRPRPGPAWMGVTANLKHVEWFNLTMEYLVETTVTSVEPSSGLAAGGLVILVKGTGLTTVVSPLCQFGNLTVPAFNVSHKGESLLCRVPPLMAVDSTADPESEAVVEFRVVSGVGAQPKINTARSALAWKYVPRIRILSIRPAVLSYIGGALLDLHVSGYEANTSYICTFVDDENDIFKEVAVESIQDSESGHWIRCRSPAFSSHDRFNFRGSLHPEDPRTHAVGHRVFVDVGRSRREVSGQPHTISLTEPIALTSLHPAAVPEMGGATVSVRGSGFLPSGTTGGPTLGCDFDGIRVPARWVSSMELRCAAPVHIPAIVRFSVSNNGIEWTDPVKFSFYAIATATSVTPNTATTSGGTMLTIAGIGFKNATTVACYFKYKNDSSLGLPRARSQAIFVSPEVIRCPTPTLPAGQVTVEVGWWGSSWTNIAGEITVVAPLSIMALNRYYFPETGSASVRITLSAPAPFSGHAIQCYFGGFASGAAHIISTTELVCAVPPLSSVLSAVFERTLRQETAGIAYGVTRTTIALGDSAGLHTSTIPTHVFYQAIPEVTAVSPSVMYASGGTTLRLHGSGFLLTPELFVRIGGKNATSVRWISGGELEVIPPANTPAVHRIEVTNNGFDWFGSADVVYVPSATVTSSSPSAGPAKGSTLVTIHGTGFNVLRAHGNATSDNSIQVFCRFGSELPVKAVIFSDTTLTCLSSPANAQGIVPLRVLTHPALVNDALEPAHPEVNWWNDASLQNETLSSLQELTFWYQANAEVHSIVPNSGIGGTNVHVTLFGKNFVDSSEIRVRFGDSTYLRPTRVNSTAVSVTLPLPATEKELAIPVEVSNNNQDYTNSAVLFFAEAAMTIRYVTPYVLDALRPTELSIHGTGFAEVYRDRFFCNFGEFGEYPAQWLHVELLRCVAPPVPATATDVHVSVTFDKIFYTVPSMLNVTKDFVVLSVVPAISAIYGGTTAFIHVTLIPKSDQKLCRWVFPINGSSLPGANVSVTTPVAVLNETYLSCMSPVSPVGPALAELQVIVLTESQILETKVQGFANASAVPFQFVTQPVLTTVFPRLGPASGNVQLTLVGMDFVNLTRMYCRFALADGRVSMTVATFISSQRVDCISPPFKIDIDSGFVPTSLSVVDGDASIVIDGVISYALYPDFTISRIEPNYGSVAGNIPIFIHGRHFSDTGLIRCRFEDLGESEGTFITPRLVKCLSKPSREPRTVYIDVTQNAFNFTPAVNMKPNETRFEYTERTLALSLFPYSGPRDGGSIVSIFGANFHADLARFCLVADMEPLSAFKASEANSTSVLLPAKFISSSHVQCRMPRRLKAENVTVQIVSAARPDDMESPHTYDQDIEYPSGNLVFEYLAPVAVHAIFPVSGPSSGGTVASITGVNFVNSSELTCRISGSNGTSVFMTIPAKYINSTTMSCLMPSTKTVESNMVGLQWASNLTSIVSVSVSYPSGIEFSHAVLQFTYYTAPLVSHFEPNRGPGEGGHIVRIHGSNFNPLLANNIVCRFGVTNPSERDTIFRNRTIDPAPVFMKGTYVNPSLVTCATPPMPVQPQVQQLIIQADRLTTPVRRLRLASKSPAGNEVQRVRISGLSQAREIQRVSLNAANNSDAVPFQKVTINITRRVEVQELVMESMPYVPEVQRVSVVRAELSTGSGLVSYARARGYFALNVGGAATAPISPEASAEQVRIALAALEVSVPGISSVKVTKEPQSADMRIQASWLVTFDGIVGSRGQITADTRLLMDGLIEASTIVDAIACEVQDVAIHTQTLNPQGFLQCSYRGSVSDPVDVRASEATFAAVIGAIPTVGTTVKVLKVVSTSSTRLYTFRVIFLNGDTATIGDLPLLSCASINVTDTTGNPVDVTVYPVLDGRGVDFSGFMNVSAPNGKWVRISTDAAIDDIIQMVQELGVLPSSAARGSGTVTPSIIPVEGRRGRIWKIVYPAAAANVPAIKVSVMDLVGTGFSAVVRTITDGTPLQTIRVSMLPVAPGNRVSGSYRIALGGEVTPELPVIANSTTIKQALETLSPIRQVAVDMIAQTLAGIRVNSLVFDIIVVSSKYPLSNDATSFSVLGIDSSLRGSVLSSPNVNLINVTVSQTRSDSLFGAHENAATGNFFLGFTAPVPPEYVSTTALWADSIPFGAPQSLVKERLQSLPILGNVEVVRSSSISDGTLTLSYSIFFGDSSRAVPLLVVDTSQLATVGQVSSSVVSSLGAGACAAYLAPIRFVLSAPWISSAISNSISADTRPDVVAREVEKLLGISTGAVSANKTRDGMASVFYDLLFPGSLGNVPTLVPTLVNSFPSDAPSNCGPSATATEVRQGIRAAVQRLELIANSVIYEGNYTLYYNGARTKPIRHDASPVDIAQALKDLPTIGLSGVEVSQEPSPDNYNAASGRVYYVTFVSNPGPVPLLQGDPNERSLVSNATWDARVLVTTVVAGEATPLSGDFILEVGGKRTPPISIRASATALEAALLDLPTVGIINVTSTIIRDDVMEWEITFDTMGRRDRRGQLAFVQRGDIPDMGVIPGGLAGTLLNATSYEMRAGSFVDGVFRLFASARPTDATEFLPLTVDADVLRSALERLPQIGEGNILSVRREPAFVDSQGVTPIQLLTSGYNWYITFSTAVFDGVDIGVDTTLMVGHDTKEVMTLVENGASGLRGMYQLSVGRSNRSSALIPYNAASNVLAAALEGLPEVGSVTVTRRNLHPKAGQGYVYYITFTNKGAPDNIVDMPRLHADTRLLRGANSTVTLTKTTSPCCDLELSFNDGVDFTRDGVQYRFVHAPSISSVYPAAAPISGGTDVLILGSGFSSNSNYYGCRFGSYPITPARFMNTSAISCKTPSGSPVPGIVNVSVVSYSFFSTGSTVTSAKPNGEPLEFAFFDVIQLTLVSPPSSPISIIRNLIINGMNFVNSSTLSCRFRLSSYSSAMRPPVSVATVIGEIPSTLTLFTPATYFNVSTVSCDTPYVPSVLQNDTIGVRTVLLDITANMVDFPPLPLPFFFEPASTATFSSPKLGPSIGGTVVTVRGNGFMNTNNLSCIFGDELATNAEYVDDSAVKCSAPPAVEVVEELQRISFIAPAQIPTVYLIVARGASSIPVGGRVRYRLLGSYPGAEPSSYVDIHSVVTNKQTTGVDIVASALRDALLLDNLFVDHYSFASPVEELAHLLSERSDINLKGDVVAWYAVTRSHPGVLPDLSVVDGSLISDLSFLPNIVFDSIRTSEALNDVRLEIYKLQAGDVRPARRSVLNISTVVSGGRIAPVMRLSLRSPPDALERWSITVNSDATRYSTPSSPTFSLTLATASPINDPWPSVPGRVLITAALPINATADAVASAIMSLNEMPPVRVTGGPFSWEVISTIPGNFRDLQFATTMPTTGCMIATRQGSMRTTGSLRFRDARNRVTTPLSVLARSNDIVTALQAAMPNIGELNVNRVVTPTIPTLKIDSTDSGTVFVTWTITFVGLDSTRVDALNITLDSSQIIGRDMSLNFTRSVVGTPLLSGSFELTSDKGSAVLDSLASARDMNTALQSILDSAYGDVLVSRIGPDVSMACTWIITFPASISREPTIKRNASRLIGMNVDVEIISSVRPITPTVRANVSITFRGQSTDPIAISEPASTLATALESLPTIGTISTFEGTCVDFTTKTLYSSQDCKIWLVLFRTPPMVKGAGFVVRHFGPQPLLQVAVLPSEDISVETTVSAQVARTRVGRGLMVPVRVANDGVNYSPVVSDAYFSYFAEPPIVSMFPEFGPTVGGNKVVLWFTYRDDVLRAGLYPLQIEGVEPYCKFGEVSVPATVNVTAMTITCLAPAHDAGRVFLSLSYNGQVFMPTGRNYTFMTLSQVMRAAPRSGPVTGGTRVTLHGVSFSIDEHTLPPLELVRCRFGIHSTPVQAKSISTQQIVCISPPSNEKGFVQLEITLNGQDYSRFATQYMYEEIHHVVRIVPPTGPMYGSTGVAVFGFGFKNASSYSISGGPSETVEISKDLTVKVGELRCRYGDVEVPAFFVSSTEVYCTSPPLMGTSEVQIVTFTATHNDSAIAALTGVNTRLSIYKACAADTVNTVSGSATSSLVFDAWLLPQICIPRETTQPVSIMSDSATLRHLISSFRALRASVRSIDISRSTVSAVDAMGLPVNTTTISWKIIYGTLDADVDALTVLLVDPAEWPAGVQNVSSNVTTFVGGRNAEQMRELGSVSVALELTFNGQDYTNDAVQFTYQRPARIFALYPHHGPLTGGTKVIIEGENFVSTSSVYCLFGSLSGRANETSGLYSVPITEYIDDKHVICRTPPTLKPGPVPVRISLHGPGAWANYSLSAYGISDVDFTYDQEVTVYRVEPPLGPSEGGALVRIIGSGFLPSFETQCRFGGITVPATWVDSTIVMCTAPKHNAGTVPLEITVNGLDFTDNSLAFTYHPPLSMSFIEPVSGPALAAGTAVTVRGTGFFNSSLLSCRFGDIAVPAIYISLTEIKCYTPPITEGLKWERLVDHVTTYPHPIMGSRRLFPSAAVFPFFLSRLVAVDVSDNAQEYTQSGLRFLYQADARVEAVFPRSGRDTGTIPLFIYGRNYVNSTALKCRIGVSTSPAVFISTKLVMCFTPQRSPNFMMHGTMRHGRLYDAANFEIGDAARTFDAEPGIVFVEVSNNGVDFTNDRKTYEHLAPCPPGSFCPPFEDSTDILCPRGTFCSGAGNTNFTMCPRGTYQPLAGQTTCQRCPIGFMCPEEGMHVPRICPAGFVCDVPGTERAEQPCPEGHFCLEGTATTATTCGNPKYPSSRLYPSQGHAEMPTTYRVGHRARKGELILGARNTACWDNSTADLGLQTSRYAMLFWQEAHQLPLSPTTPFQALRGRFCQDDRCMRLADEGSLAVTDAAFDYASQGFPLRRPVPCPEGTYCSPGTAANAPSARNLTTPQPCYEHMFCPEGSTNPLGFGEVPAGFYSPYGVKLPCPAGTYCPFLGTRDPLPCPPGTFNGMVGQYNCTLCALGYICPGFGRIDPAICPPGFVCSRKGLPSPNTLCPAGFFCPNGTVTADPFRNDTSLRPYPCRPGTYCLAGTGYDKVDPYLPTYSKNCTPGFYCEAASPSPLGTGLCPRGFVCPEGTAVPIPTERGYYAENFGTSQAARCRPGYYAPTVQTVECYPCPPGTTCENDGTVDATICPPGTYRSLIESEGVVCLGCPQGSWSKQWEVRDKKECITCPPGVVCPVDGMRNPCSTADFPLLWELAENIIERELFLPPRCNMFPNHLFGYLTYPVFQRRNSNNTLEPTGPYITHDPDNLNPNSNCYYNPRPKGSIVYQRMKDYYGPHYELQMGRKHQGYGNDTYYGYFNLGSRAIDLPVTPVYDLYNNCTSGIWAVNSTNNEYRWLPGTCEVDIICNYNGRTQSQQCAEGFVCPEGITALTAVDHPCPGGYVCDIGSTPDISILAPQSQFKKLCPAGYYCLEGTGPTTQFRSSCPAGYFCPSGTYEPLLGKQSNDGIMRNMSVAQANPFEPILEWKYLPDVAQLTAISAHDEQCYRGVNTTNLITWKETYDKYGRMAPVNVADEANMLCARDHKWRMVYNTIARQECECVSQILTIHQVYLIWACSHLPANKAVCNFKNLRIPSGRTIRTRSRTTPWENIRLAFPNGDGYMLSGVQVPARAPSKRYWRDCEPTYMSATWAPAASVNRTFIDRRGNQITVYNALNANCTQRGPDGLVADAKCPVFCNFAELKNWIEPRFADAASASDLGKLTGDQTKRIDPLIYDLKYAVDLLDTVANLTRPEKGDDDFFDYKHDILDYVNFVPKVEPLKPLRYDMCACENTLRCPNGTTSDFRADQVFQCYKTGDEVLRRIVPLPMEHPSLQQHDGRPRLRDLYEDRGGLPVLHMYGGEQAVITFNLTNMPLNLTYLDHFQLSVYADCDPCPPRYRCNYVNLDKDNNPTCKWPPYEEQQDLGFFCAECCKCRPKALPSWITNPVQQYPFFDNKHKVWTFTLTALHETNLLVVMELLHGLYYGDFDTAFNDIAEMYVHSPQRAISGSSRPSNTSNPRNMFFAFLSQPNFKKLTLPYNLPMTRQPQLDPTEPDLHVFENDVLIDRPSDTRVAHPRYPQQVTDRRMYPNDDTSRGNLNPLSIDWRLNIRNPDPDIVDLESLQRRLQETREISWAQAITGRIEYAATRTVSGIRRILQGASNVTTDSNSTDATNATATPTPTLDNIPDNPYAASLCFDIPYLPYYESFDQCQQRIALGFVCKGNETQVPCGERLEDSLRDWRTLNNIRVRPTDIDFTKDIATDVAEDVTWWANGDPSGPFNMIALPYLPFFSSCIGYDSHVHIARLMEDNPACTQVPYDRTKYVDKWPWVGKLVPTADECLDKLWVPNPPSDIVRPGVTLFCDYEEDVFVPPTVPRWFETEEGTVLWHMTKNPMPFGEMEGKYNQYPFPDVMWGRTDRLQAMIGSEELIPVMVEPGEVLAESTLIPRTINFTMRYYQVDRSTKRLVLARMQFGNYCTVTNSLTLQKGFLARGIPLCQKGDYTFQLKFGMAAMWWLDLLNYFQFPVEVYILLYVLIGFIVAFLGFIIWLVHRLISRLSVSPEFKYFSLAGIVTPAPIAGTLLISIPIYAMAFGFIFYWIMTRSVDPENAPSAINFEGYEGNWLGDGTIDSWRLGRLGTSMIVAGMYVLCLSGTLFIPKGSGGQQELRDFLDDPAEKIEDMAEKANDDDDDDGDEGAEGFHTLWTPRRWKRGHFLLITLLLIMALLVILEFSFSKTFSKLQFFFVIALRFACVVLDQVLRRTLREVILVAPIMVAVQIMEVFILAGAVNFTDYAFAFLLRMGVIIVSRLYIEPFVRWLFANIPQWYLFMRKRIRANWRLTREQRLSDEQSYKRIREDNAASREGVEPLLESFFRYSTETTALVMQPFIQLMLYIFDASPLHKFKTTQIAEMYDIRPTDLIYYSLFNVIIIPFQLALDMFLFNALELFYGWKIFEYISFQRYRYSIREGRWLIATNKFDAAIRPSLQRADMMCFSSQYYFMLSLHAWGMFLVIFGVATLLHNDYDPFADWVLVIIVLAVWIACGIGKSILRRIGNLVRLWMRPTLEGTVEDELAARLRGADDARGQGDYDDLEWRALNSDSMRQRFLDRNRAWLLAHIADLITPRSLEAKGPDGQPRREYIRKLYDELKAMRPGEEDQYGGMRDGMDPDDLDRWGARALQPAKPSTKKIAIWWLGKARRRKTYQRLADPTIAAAKKDKCGRCKCAEGPGKLLKSHLASDGMIDVFAIDTLIAKFERTVPGGDRVPINEPGWKDFVRKNATFATRCDQCAALDIKEAVDAYRKETGQEVEKDDGDDLMDDIPYDLLTVDRTAPVGKLLKKWLDSARHKLGGNFPRPGAEDAMREYLRRARAKERAAAKAKMDAEKAAEEARNKPKGRPGEAEDALPSNLEEIKLTPASKNIMLQWLISGRASRIDTDEAEGRKIRADLRQMLSKVPATEDWFFGRDNRMKGAQLVGQGDNLVVQRLMVLSECEEAVKPFDSEEEEARKDHEDDIKSLAADDAAGKEACDLRLAMRMERIGRKRGAFVSEAANRLQAIDRAFREEAKDWMLRMKRRMAQREEESKGKQGAQDVKNAVAQALKKK
jgi:hypothetical protein